VAVNLRQIKQMLNPNYTEAYKILTRVKIAYIIHNS